MKNANLLFYISAILGISSQIFNSISNILIIIFFLIVSYQFFGLLEIREDNLRNERIMRVFKMGGLFIFAAMIGQVL